MKKLFFSIIACIGFAVTSQAQDAKELYRAAEKNSSEQAKEVAELLSLKDDVYYLIKDVLQEKNDMLAQNPNLSKERKKALTEYTITKIQKALTEGEFEKLTTHYKSLFDRMISTELIQKK